MLTLTAPQKTIFHKISAGQKLLALCVVSTALFELTHDCTCVPDICRDRPVSFSGISFAKFGRACFGRFGHLC